MDYLNTVIIRNGRQDDDNKKIARLIMISAEEYFPYVYGQNIETAIEEMFKKKGNIFCHDNIIVAEKNGEIVGAAMCFEKSQDNLKNTLAFLRYCFLGIASHPVRTIRCTSQIANFKSDEFYLSNVAIDPGYQGQGMFSLMQKKIEKKASEKGYRKVVLDVETKKTIDVAIYKKCGFKIIRKINLAPFPFCFYRMEKKLE